MSRTATATKLHPYNVDVVDGRYDADTGAGQRTDEELDRLARMRADDPTLEARLLSETAVWESKMATLSPRKFVRWLERHAA